LLTPLITRMPGIGDEMDGAMQQAPALGRVPSDFPGGPAYNPGLLKI